VETDADGKAPCPACGALLYAQATCDVFISYASQDINRARELARMFRNTEISYWLAPEDRINLGNWFLSAIAKALSEAKVVVLVLSRHCVDSPWVVRELQEAANNGCAILPLKIEDFDLPRAFRMLLGPHQWQAIEEASFERWTDQVVDRVREELRNHAASTVAKVHHAPVVARSIHPAPLEGVDHSVEPYVGPRPFPPDMAGKFFGRDREAQALLEAISKSRIVRLDAPSGAGKSSLLNTKIRQSLEAGGLHVFPEARVGGVLPGNVKAADIRNIFTFSTIYALDKSAVPNPNSRLVDYLRSICRKAGTRGRVLIFDQFEELFTQHTECYEHRTGYLEDIIAALKDDPFLRVVFAIRKEYVRDIDRYATMVPVELKVEEFSLQRMGQEAALEAIIKPAAHYATYAPGVAQAIVEQLNTTRIKGFDGVLVEKRGEFIEMVHLQIVCDHLWKSLPAGIKSIEEDHLENAAGKGKTFNEFVTNALNEFYDNTIDNVANSPTTDKHGGFSKELIRLGCMKFVTPASTRTMVQRKQGRTGRLPDWIVEQLQNRHLLRSEQRGEHLWYELSHDLLAEPVGRQMDREASALLFAADLVDKLLDKVLRETSGTLQDYFEEHNDVLRECRTFHGQAGLFQDESEFLFRTSLRAGQDMREWSDRLRQDYPALRVGVLRNAMACNSPMVRRNAAGLLGQTPVDDLLNDLVDLALVDDDLSVRHAAAVSLARLDRPQLYETLTAKLKQPATKSAASEALSRIRIVTDRSARSSSFENSFCRLRRAEREVIRRNARRIRFREGLIAFPFLVVPAAFLAATAAATFKWLPGMAGWALTQASHGAKGAAMGAFHGAIAGVVWAGLIVLGLTFYYVVFGREQSTKSLLRPFAALGVGAVRRRQEITFTTLCATCEAAY